MDNLDEIMEECYKNNPPIPYKVLDSHPEYGNIYKLTEGQILEILFKMDEELYEVNDTLSTINEVLNGGKVLTWQ